MHDMTTAEENEFEFRRSVTREAVETVIEHVQCVLDSADDVELATEMVLGELRSRVESALSAADPEDQLLGYREGVLDDVCDRVMEAVNWTPRTIAETAACAVSGS